MQSSYYITLWILFSLFFISLIRFSHSEPVTSISSSSYIDFATVPFYVMFDFNYSKESDEAQNLKLMTFLILIVVIIQTPLLSWAALSVKSTLIIYRIEHT